MKVERGDGGVHLPYHCLLNDIWYIYCYLNGYFEWRNAKRQRSHHVTHHTPHLYVLWICGRFSIKVKIKYSAKTATNLLWGFKLGFKTAFYRRSLLASTTEWFPVRKWFAYLTKICNVGMLNVALLHKHPVKTGPSMITYKAQKTTEIQYLADMPEPYVYMIKQRQRITALHVTKKHTRIVCEWTNHPGWTFIDWLVGQGTGIANR